MGLNVLSAHKVPDLDEMHQENMQKTHLEAMKRDFEEDNMLNQQKKDDLVRLDSIMADKLSPEEKY